MNFAPVTVNVGGLKINAMDHASVLNMGPSQHLDLFISYKRNQGIGEQNGDRSPVILAVSWISDCDAVDSLSIKKSVA